VPIDLILANIRRWEKTRASSAAQDQLVREQIAECLKPFLGEQGTQRVLVLQANDNARLLSTVENILRTFVGQKAAEAVVSRAMDSAIIRS